MCFLSSLYILDINLLSEKQLAKIFSHAVSSLLRFLIVSFSTQKLFSLMQSHVLIHLLISSAFGVLFRKFVPVPIGWSIDPMPSSSNCKVSGLISRSLIHLELTFVQGEKVGILLIHKEEQNYITCRKMDEPGEYFVK